MGGVEHGDVRGGGGGRAGRGRVGGGGVWVGQRLLMTAFWGGVGGEGGYRGPVSCIWCMVCCTYWGDKKVVVDCVGL